ncbi:MAG: PQQ-binding-like beta-propeller repeat protein [Oscillospiraceae bacterium]
MGNNRDKTPNGGRIIILAAVLAVLVGVLAFIIYMQATIIDAAPPTVMESSPQQTAEPTPAPTVEPTPEPTPFDPHWVESTNPENFIKSTSVMVDGEIVTDYHDDNPISFGESSEYTAVKGVTTFRGNNFRDSASYGTAKLESKTFDSDLWTVATASLTSPDGAVWTGSGWTGQPLIVEWPKELRQHMNMYDWAKQADSLVEVIYATMDGYIYFIELTGGEYTRAPLYLGYTFKGSGSLDPRGYPILYLGAGYDSNQGKSHAFIISLIDCSIMYEFGANDAFALRQWPMFDGAPLVDADTDKLIYPGENGIIYIITLGTQYDEAAGTVSVNPSKVVKWRYTGKRTTTYTYWLGMEASAIIWQSHLIIPDNGGNLMCLDLNTLTLDWVQDIQDDSNSTPVLELEDGHPYIYVSTSFHAGWRAPENGTADVPIWKIDAVTGEIVWSVSYKCHTVSGVSGGVQGSIAIGKNNLSDLIFVPVARTPEGSTGVLVALDKKTGKEVWSVDTQMYSWSSPAVVYDENGDGYIIYCTSGFYIYLLDGRTKEKLDSMNIGGNIEASPAVYENYVVVGHRAQQIYGIRMK